MLGRVRSTTYSSSDTNGRGKVSRSVEFGEKTNVPFISTVRKVVLVLRLRKLEAGHYENDRKLKKQRLLSLVCLFLFQGKMEILTKAKILL